MVDSSSLSWVISAFAQSMRTIGATADMQTLQDEGQRLLDNWSEDHRSFHTLPYLTKLLDRIDEVEMWSHNPDMLRIATWYYASICNPHEGSILSQDTRNREDSAVIASRQLHAFGVDEDTCHTIVRYILSVHTHRLEDDDNDHALFLDVLFAYLSAIPQDYQEYRHSMRQEYPLLSDEDYMAERLRYVQALLERDSIFFSPMSDTMEMPARQNLEREAHKLSSCVSSCDCDDSSASIQPSTDTESTSDEVSAFHDGSTPLSEQDDRQLPAPLTYVPDDSDMDTATIIIRARTKSSNGSRSATHEGSPSTSHVQYVPSPPDSDTSETMTPVLGIPVQPKVSREFEDENISTLESAIECLNNYSSHTLSSSAHNADEMKDDTHAPTYPPSAHSRDDSEEEDDLQDDDI